MASKECDQTFSYQNRILEAVGIELKAKLPEPRKRKHALLATGKFNEKGKKVKVNPKPNPSGVDRLNNEKNPNLGVKAEPKCEEYFESKSVGKKAARKSSENIKVVEQNFETRKERNKKNRRLRRAKLLAKQEKAKTKEILLSQVAVKIEPVESEKCSEVINPVVKAELIANEYQIKLEDNCMKKEVKLEFNGMEVKTEPVDIKDCFKQTDADDRKLFVGGLPTHAKTSDIQDHFEKFGEIEEIILKMDPVTGRSRGFAFITFKTVDGLGRALVTETQTFLGKNISIKKAESKQGKIYVGKIPDEITSEQIKSHFSNFGTITQFEQPVDKISKKRKDFCFITFKKESSAKQLIQTGLTTICGAQINVKKVTPQNQKTDMVGLVPFFGPRSYFGPTHFFGPRPMFGSWQNVGPGSFAPMGSYASQPPWANY